MEGLMKRGRKHNGKVEADDPFVNQEDLHNYCSLFSPDGIPSNIRGDPYLAEIINFSEESLNDIAQVQNLRCQREREAEIIEEMKREQQEIADQKIKKTLDRQVDKMFRDNAFYLKKQCPVKIPYKSSLTHEEHAAYLRAFLKFSIRSARTAAETTEYENYLRLQHRVYDEQKNFMDFAYQVARLELQTYNTVPEVITKFIDDYVQHHSKRAAKYAEHYVSEQQVPICPQDPEKHLSDLSFSHLGHLLSLGTLPQFMIPSKYKLHTLEIDDSLSKKYCTTESVVPDQKILSSTPVSGDRNAEYLAQHHRANIVISTSAMKVLADNHSSNFDKEWDIPVEVKSYSVKDLDGREVLHRVVYIDKPMPKKTWTPLDKKQLYFKKAALEKFSVINKAPMFRMKAPFIFHPSYTHGASRKVKGDDSSLDLSNVSENDFIGAESAVSRNIRGHQKRKVEREKKEQSPAKATKVEMSAVNICAESGLVGEKIPDSRVEEVKLTSTKKSKVKDEVERKTDAPRANSDLLCKQKDSVENFSADKTPVKDTQYGTNQGDPNVNSENFLESLLMMQDSLLKPLQTQNETTEMNDGDETSAPNTSPKRPWTHHLHTDWKNFLEPHICPAWTGKNVHYHLFSLSSNTCMSNGSIQSLRILVRSNLHGLSRMRFPKKCCKTYITYPKIESQAYFGCEVSTLSEITQQWVQLLVRPNTTVFQVRVCEGSGEILMTEERDLAAILKEGKQLHVGFSPHRSLATLYSVFSAVLGQPTGQYLLHHDPKTKAFIQLMKACNPNQEANQHMYNLHKAYAAASVSTRNYTIPPWLTIDTHVLSPFHMKHKKIPGTFPMSNPKQKQSSAKRKKKIQNSMQKKSLQDI